jgi:hypothetical protein
MTGAEMLCSRQRGLRRGLGGRGGEGGAPTSADALFLPRQDAGAVDDADALQDLVGQLGAHEPGRDGPKVRSETGLCRGF